MSIHLVGGGWQDEPDGVAYRGFVAEATAHAATAGRGIPTLAVIAVRDDGADHASKLIAAARPAGAFETDVTAVAEDGVVPASAFDGVDGIMIGGGLTPAYRDVLEPCFDVIRERVLTGVPYLGFSAGSAIAATHALVGGWRIGGVPVAPEDGAEDLDDVTVLPGVGLVDIAVDVHAAQCGTVSRLLAAVEAGLVDAGVAIDENTVLIAGDGPLKVAGAGSVWSATRLDQGVLVRTLGA